MVDERLAEVDYGQWTGRKIGDLVKEPLWSVVQQQPSAAVFPDGEGLAAGAGPGGGRGPRARPPARRASTARDVLWVACTHGDVIKAVVADALGTHLDSFQRITADPASMSVIRYTPIAPVRASTSTTPAAQLAVGSDRSTAAESTDAAGDAVVGGSTD